MRYVFGADFSGRCRSRRRAGATRCRSTQKASLAGRRLVTSSEVTKQGRLNEELVKSLTGSDAVNARHPYGRPFTFIPSAKFILRVNEKPRDPR